MGRLTIAPVLRQGLNVCVEIFVARLHVYWRSFSRPRLRRTPGPPLAFALVRKSLSFDRRGILLRPIFYPLTETVPNILSSCPPARPLPTTFLTILPAQPRLSVTFLNHDSYFGLLCSFSPP
jgi:hypothetical protein